MINLKFLQSEHELAGKLHPDSNYVRRSPASLSAPKLNHCLIDPVPNQ